MTWDVLRDPVFPDAFLSFPTIIPLQRDTKKVPEDWADTLTVHAESARPLADTLLPMERQLKKVIIFEDVPHLCSCDVMRDREGKPYSPRGGIFGFSYSFETKPTQVLVDATEAYNKRNGGKFVAKPVDQAFYIYPTEVMSKDEQVLPREPLLKTPVSLPANQKSASEILKTFCQALSSKTEWKVTLGQLPLLPAFDKALTLEPAEKPAVEYLVELSKKMGGNISWQLLYEPRLKGYVLNAHEIKAGPR
jgi:hypothetical protein